MSKKYLTKFLILENPL